MPRGAPALVMVAALIAATAPARADVNDLVMSRLANRVDANSIIPQNLEFRTLASQLGVVLAPHLLTPADTLGFAGFQITADYTTTTIDRDGAFWRAREGATDPTGAMGPFAPDSMSTFGIFVRKGLWLPVPSFEFGAGVTHLVDSHVWTGQLYAKLALHEGYHQLPIPSLAVRGAVSRMMTQKELDLTVASLDITVSKHFGIGGTWKLNPYGGWNLLVIVPRSEVIDPTPNVDPLDPTTPDDNELSFVFRDQDNILRHRLFAGVKVQYYVVQFTLEGSYILAGSSVDDRAGVTAPCTLMSETQACDAKDGSPAQRTLALSVGLDF